MGHAHSKKRQEKRRRKEAYTLKAIDDGGTSCLQHNPHVRLHRLSGDIDRNFFSSDIGSVGCNKMIPNPGSNDGLQGGEAFGIENMNSHPVLTRLQNEQNKRWENMEQRMNKIRTSAMQEAERRKYAQMFKAKQNDDRTKVLLQKASAVLSSDIMRERLPPPTLMEEEEEEEDSDCGEIIPVKILTQKEDKQCPKYLQILPSNLAGMNLSKFFFFMR